jgi:hypothetical protein
MRNQRANLPANNPDNKHIADAKRPALNQHCRHRATPSFQPGFHHNALGQPIRVGLELQHFGLQENHLQQGVQAGLLFGRNLNHDRVTAPGLGYESMFR